MADNGRLAMRKWFGLALAAGAIVFTAVVYNQLPDQIPTHWNIRGEVDGWSSRARGAFMLPAMAVGIWLLMRFLPKIDPRRQNYERFRGSYDFVANAVVGFLALLQVVVLGAALGWPIDPGRIVAGGVGVLFIIIGNLLPRARPTWFFGIRTPWTLSNDRVWERTHRLGGYLFALAGLLFVGAALFPGVVPMAAVPVAVFAVVAITFVYSIVAWRQEKT